MFNCLVVWLFLKSAPRLFEVLDECSDLNNIEIIHEVLDIINKEQWIHPQTCPSHGDMLWMQSVAIKSTICRGVELYTISTINFSIHGCNNYNGKYITAINKSLLIFFFIWIIRMIFVDTENDMDTINNFEKQHFCRFLLIFLLIFWS